MGGKGRVWAERGVLGLVSWALEAQCMHSGVEVGGGDRKSRGGWLGVTRNREGGVRG